MKVPDLAAVDECGVHDWKGAGEPLKSAAAHAGLKYASIDLGKAKDKATLFAELDRALALPDHFGHNWDALADVLEDRDWLGRKGRAILLAHVFFNLAVVVRVVGGLWAHLDERYAQAARTLGATPVTVWRTVTWPLLGRITRCWWWDSVWPRSVPLPGRSSWPAVRQCDPLGGCVR